MSPQPSQSLLPDFTTMPLIEDPNAVVDISSFIPFRPSEPSSVLLAFAVVVAVLLIVRIACVFFSPSTAARQGAQDEKVGLMKWYKWQWEGLPLSLSLPISLEMGEQVGAGVGVTAAKLQMQMEMEIQARRQQQAALVHPPLPAPYESRPPLSAAKIIMSRHTYRRPNPNRAPRPSPARSQSTSAPSRVPPSSASSLAAAAKGSSPAHPSMV